MTHGVLYTQHLYRTPWMTPQVSSTRLYHGDQHPVAMTTDHDVFLTFESACHISSTGVRLLPHWPWEAGTGPVCVGRGKRQPRFVASIELQTAASRAAVSQTREYRRRPVSDSATATVITYLSNAQIKTLAYGASGVQHPTDTADARKPGW